MGATKDQYFAKLDAMGEAEVREKQLMGAFMGQHRAWVQIWLDERASERGAAAAAPHAEAARRQAEAAETSAAAALRQAKEAEEANRIARLALDKAQTANKIATVALIVAIVSAVVLGFVQIVF